MSFNLKASFMFHMISKIKPFYVAALLVSAGTLSLSTFAQEPLITEQQTPEIVTEQLDAPAAPSEDFLELPGVDNSIDFGEVDDNLYYDSDALVPTGEIGLKGGPRKVNPAVEPGSKLIVVRKNHSSGSRQAKLVSADRAMSLGRYDSALTFYDELYARNKRDPNILLGRATALQQLGQDEAAIQAYEELLDLRPNNVEAQINMLGILGKKYPAVALKRLLDLRERHDRHVGIAAQIAVVQAELGRYEEAVRYLGMAAGLEPQNASHLFNMAVIADRSGDKTQAVKYYEQALEVDTVYGGGRSIPRDQVFSRLARLR